MSLKECVGDKISDASVSKLSIENSISHTFRRERKVKRGYVRKSLLINQFDYHTVTQINS